MKKIAGHWQILMALVLAVGLGTIFRNLSIAAGGEGAFVDFARQATEVSSFIGDLFMSALKMIIVPLIVSSIIAGIGALGGVKGFGRLGAKTFGFYALTSLFAILVGLTLVNLIEPGIKDGQPNQTIAQAFEKASTDVSDAEKAKIEQANQRKATDYADFFKKMFPPNIIAAASDNGQMLGLIVFSILFGVGMTRVPPGEMRHLQGTMQGINDVMVLVTQWIMSTAPIGVFALMFPVIYDAGWSLVLELGKYFATVLLALGIHLFVVLPLILKFVGKVSPIAHFKAMGTALLTAFSTASSSATLPVTMRCIQENAGVSRRTSSFTLPLGATVNMDGTALYECVAVMFVAQVMGFDMSFGSQFVVVGAALLTSIGVAGVPSASLVAILLILKNSNIPNAEVAVAALLAVDRLLDMSRTAVNVFGDSCAAVVVASSEGEDVLTGNPTSSAE
ncbi:Na+/H+-dicarboxylate symporter [Rubritalea squalenifaciens DSM 18772]|uniref:Na+/H+-dicarboxylate symporter n=1 Tax=Rubritalea squalenifaciens DSM 18772 TaxID=1123071 RepID=A0A1M6EUV5_9BACT|nr:dicarboxylate/amino acid:cation symporter [Rubritalea squalenifaciens]SHI89212.1 Na+/H+-dicarboxylate symporter [Rubritalea squalenifaciens DSM 18772]